MKYLHEKILTGPGQSFTTHDEVGNVIDCTFHVHPEYELIYTVKYQLIIDHEQTQDFSFELNRDYQDDPDKALAKSRELSLILSELRREAADHILRNLSSYNAAN